MEKQIILVENYFVINGTIKPVKDYNYFYSSNSKIIYEVIRVKNSTPLFFEQHIDRLFNSINLIGLYQPDKFIIRDLFVDLLLKNPVEENNIRLSLIYNSASTPPDILIYFIPSSYPTEIQKKNGVSIRTLNANRENPNAKIENKNLRETANRIIKESNCYEVLLVDNNRFITEGSRSNIFFSKDNILHTPPLEMVLGGITRQVVRDLSKKIRIPTIEEKISVDQLNEFDSAFLTGTSPGILPIFSINDIKFEVNAPIFDRLIAEYNNAIEMDIINFTKIRK